MALTPIFSNALSSTLKASASVFTGKFKSGNPIVTQKGILRGLIRRAQKTEFGREHRFDLLSGLPMPQLYREFRRAVPIRTYDDLWKEYFSRGVSEIDGKVTLQLDNVTWPGTIRFFCETSGTTAPTKFIPFTKEMFRANKWAALDLMSCYLSRRPDSKLFGGRILYMAGSTELTSRGDDIVSGDMSGITLARAPWFLKPFVAPGKDISSLPWEQKLERLTDLLLEDGDIRGISGVPPWILLLLQRCAEKGGKALFDLLPNLELIIHGGTSMKPYRKEFDQLFAEAQPAFLEVLPSSEAFMGFQVHGEEYMRLTPFYGAFFEFVRFSDLDDKGRPAPDADAIPLSEVVPGERYAIILSTCAGLWRYHIGDTIRFLSKNPLHFEFTGRDRFLDRFEEKVTQGEVEEAITRLNAQGLQVREFVVGPEIEDRRHRWILAAKAATSALPEVAEKVLDRTLMDLNADYATFRSQGRIAAPAVTIVSEDTIYEWSRNIRGKLGGQTKIPHVDPTLEGDMVKSLLAFIS